MQSTSLIKQPKQTKKRQTNKSFSPAACWASEQLSCGWLSPILSNIFTLFLHFALFYMRRKFKTLREKNEEIKQIFSFLVRSCLLITLITCLKGHKSLRVLYSSVFQKCVVLSEEATYTAAPLF